MTKKYDCWGKRFKINFIKKFYFQSFSTNYSTFLIKLTLIKSLIMQTIEYSLLKNGKMIPSALKALFCVIFNAFYFIAANFQITVILQPFHLLLKLLLFFFYFFFLLCTSWRQKNESGTSRVINFAFGDTLLLSDFFENCYIDGHVTFLISEINIEAKKLFFLQSALPHHRSSYCQIWYFKCLRIFFPQVSMDTLFPFYTLILKDNG